MEPVAEPLRFFGAVPEVEALPWSWVEQQLTDAPTYWVVARSSGQPHPRPVWGVFADSMLHLSIGSPVLARQVAADADVTVHLDSGVDVVIVEGVAQLETPEETAVHRPAYDAKYDWQYDIDEYGPLTGVKPSSVLAWRSAGPAGRDGWHQTGRWRFT